MLARLSFAAATLAAAFVPPAAAQDAARLYINECGACHMRDPRTPAAELAARTTEDYATFERIVRTGEGPTGEMPAFSSDSISDEQLRALHAYLLAARPPR